MSSRPAWAINKVQAGLQNRDTAPLGECLASMPQALGLTTRVSSTTENQAWWCLSAILALGRQAGGQARLHETVSKHHS